MTAPESTHYSIHLLYFGTRSSTHAIPFYFSECGMVATNKIFLLFDTQRTNLVKLYHLNRPCCHFISVCYQ